tara:strand:- start:716 stop:1093 length:378 start_codon:yes stop_codon:yes gene_type:complete
MRVKIIYTILLLSSATCYTQTKEEVYKYITESGIKHPDIVYKQVLYETGHLKCSPCSLQHNNLLGFRLHHKHMDFNSWQESIDYYFGWQKRRKYSEDEDYYVFLKRVWGAPDMTQYVSILKNIKT